MTKPIELSHVALVVRDPWRTANLLDEAFGARAVRHRDEDGHDETYAFVCGIRFVLVAAEVDRDLTGDHVAFHADAAQMHAIAARLRALHHPYRMARADTALYFADYDNHVFEIETTGLDAEPGCAAG